MDKDKFCLMQGSGWVSQTLQSNSNMGGNGGWAGLRNTYIS